MKRSARSCAAFAAAMLLLGAAAGCGASLNDAAPAVGVTVVAVRDNTFAPRVIQVTAGNAVTWDWDEARRAHNVVGAGFASDVQPDGSFRHVFDQPGTFDYLCTLHGGMRGRVIVTP